MSAAEREAERRYHWYVEGAQFSGGRAVRAAFVAGAEWQAEQDADLRAERDAAREAPARVRAIHQRAECLDMQGEPYDPPEYYCEHCYPNVWDWPCPTIRALDKEPRHEP